MLPHRRCDNVESVENAAEMMKKSGDYRHLEKSFSDMIDQLQSLVEIRVKNMIDCENDISRIREDISSLFENAISHMKSLRDDALKEVADAEKEILPHLESERDELKCKISAIENDIQLLNTNTEYAPPAQYLQAMEKLSEQSQILDRYIKDKSKTLENVRISFRASKNISDLTKSLTKIGTTSVYQQSHKMLDLLAASPKLSKQEDHDIITGSVFLKNGKLLISRYTSNSLELLDKNFTPISMLALPYYPHGIKMISATKGAVAVQNTALLFFEVNDNVIKKVKQIDVPVTFDFVYHKGKYYIGSNRKIIVQDSSNQHVRDISVRNEEVGYMTMLDDDSICYTICGGRVLYCITLDGSPLFQYSHANLEGTWGVTVDFARNIYVCGHDSLNVHQLTHEGTFHRVIFDNLAVKPYCISFTRGHDKAAIGCGNKILTYTLSWYAHRIFVYSVQSNLCFYY